ncbi:UDP-N-acetylmuramate dehydrogenase [Candidatus Tachikawaea gelatinosa]|nr:UDP-N-acetylmuramate dehydrogenase [Candidatus Tachikawaea gelatinosa]
MSYQSLKYFNTFKLKVYAKSIVFAKSCKKLQKYWDYSQENNLPFLVLGQGSNVFFLENFLGLIVINKIWMLNIKEEYKYWRLHVGAGINWHNLVKFTIYKKIPGLENLAMIPGVIGAAPIQNIGAYGVDFNSICEYVDILNFNNHKKTRLYREECKFGYRNSIFKNEYHKNYAIISVGIKLYKNWQPKLNHYALTHMNKYVQPIKIFNTICSIRKKKLPDLSTYGNAGSFFKNPLIKNDNNFKNLLKKYPKISYVFYKNKQIKISGAWLIDQCNLSSYMIGGAKIYHKQPLILINKKNASPKNILDLSRYVYKTVGNKFNIWLEPEVHFIDRKGEFNAIDAFI